MEKSNLNYIFYKKYFSESLNMYEETEQQSNENSENELENPVVKSCNQKILSYKYNRESGLINNIDKVLNNRKTYFSLKTVYPGLMIGTGYFHEAEKNNDEAIKTGFSFDYVTGEPYIPGSTVKGVLRSAFKACPEYIAAILQAEGYIDFEKEQINIEEFINQLEVKIFGGQHKENSEAVVGTDIFLDSCIEKAAPHNESGESDVLQIEYITPHKNLKLEETENTKTQEQLQKSDEKEKIIEKEELEGLVNPVPLRFLKVIPDVTFKFSFILEEVEIQGKKINGEMKLKLFKEILKDMGIGAKTNVGFGILVER